MLYFRDRGEGLGYEGGYVGMDIRVVGDFIVYFLIVFRGFDLIGKWFFEF